MSEEDAAAGRDGEPGAETAPVDFDVVERTARRLRTSERFADVTLRPEYAPNAVVLAYDTGYFPAAVAAASLRFRWYRNGDFNAHYVESWQGGNRWECRWDRHPNAHNARGHYHPPPDAGTPARDRSYPADWRDVVALVLRELDDRIRGLWDDEEE